MKNIITNLTLIFSLYDLNQAKNLRTKRLTLIYPLCLRHLVNCHGSWLPVNVTDGWLSCGAPCNATTTVWRCNETSHERLLLLVNCTESNGTGKLGM